MTLSVAIPITLKQVKTYLPTRPNDAHKGLFGHILVIGGDYGMPGAVRLAGESALRMGAGLVTIVTRKAHVNAVVGDCPELLCYGIGWCLKKLTELLKQATVVVIGPGLGQSFWSRRLLHKVLASPLPMIIDADGLNLLSQIKNVPRSATRILTPHPGEAARLLNQPTASIQKQRVAAAKSLEKKYGGVVVLKGAGSLIVTTGESPRECLAGNPSMASPGMGDVLTGMIAGLLGQGLSPFEAAQAGVLLHATAADQVVEKKGSRGLLASDLWTEFAKF